MSFHKTGMIQHLLDAKATASGMKQCYITTDTLHKSEDALIDYLNDNFTVDMFLIVCDEYCLMSELENVKKPIKRDYARVIGRAAKYDADWVNKKTSPLIKPSSRKAITAEDVKVTRMKRELNKTEDEKLSILMSKLEMMPTVKKESSRRGVVPSANP